MRSYKTLAAILASSFVLVGRAQIEPVAQEDKIVTHSEVPVLGKLPVLGAFFQVDTVQDEPAAEKQRGRTLDREAAAQRREIEAERRGIEAEQRAEERALRAEMQKLTAVQRGLTRLAAPQKMENAAFLGAGVSPAKAATREQLKLDKGVGLQVDSLVAGSPAEVSGIKANDILEKFNDQYLVNVNQLVVLVRSFKGGDDVKITLVRDGQRQTLPVKLVEKEVPALDDNNPWGGLPGGLEGADTLDRFLVDLDTKVDFDNRANRAIIRGDKGNFIFTGGKGDRTTQRVFNDNNLSVTVAGTKDGKRMLTAADAKTGKEIFKGNIDTDEQRQALPAEVADVLKRMDEDQARANDLKPPTPIGFGGGGFGGGGGVAGPGGGGVAFGGGGRALVLTAPANAQNRRLPRVPPGKLDAITWSDDENTFDLTASQTGDKRDLHLVAKNAEGTILFDGPINTEDDKKALPKDLADKLTTPAVSPVIDFMRGGKIPAGGNKGPDGVNLNYPPGAPKPPRAAPGAAGNPPGALPAPALGR